MEIAGLAQVDPFDVSLELITRYVPRLTAAGKNPVQMIVDQGRNFGFIRLLVQMPASPLRLLFG